MANPFLSQTLSTKLSQQLRITPQLQQAIKLLQLSRLDLEASIQKELNENPVLEEIHETMEEDPGQQNQKNNEDLASLGSSESSNSSDQDSGKDTEFNWENYLDSGYSKAAHTRDSSDEFNNYDNLVSSPQSLQDYLIWQISLSGFNEEEINLLLLLTNYIEDDGYIKTDLGEIARNEKIELSALEEMLPFLHELDPPGVGARNLKECLLVQAQNLEEDTNDLVLLIKEHLHHLERRDFSSISKATNWSIEYIQGLHEVILEMDPKPGLSYSPKQDIEYITPDVYVYKKSEEYVVSLNEDGLPRLKISQSYRHLLQTHLNSTNKQTKDYIQEKLRSALWFIKSIQQRQKTIYKVAESIVKHQTEFLEKGPAYIKPMILRDVAQDIEMHESTVSRVTTAKYMHTPQGIFELKYFFNSGIQKLGGEVLASESVKLKIKNLIAKENLKKPLSDQKIVTFLGEEGIKIARRTVAKYREALKILPSSKRKKLF